jgi:hypothetical protein
MFRRASIAVSVMLLSSAPLIAQRAGFSMGSRPGFTTGHRSPGLTISFHGNQTGSFQRFPGLSQTFFGPGFFYPDAPFPTIPNQLDAPAPQVILIEPAQDPRHSEAEHQKPAQLLVLERRGNRFVSIAASELEQNPSTANKHLPSPAPKLRSQLVRPPVVLVFRDGRREEVDSYTIADGTLYTSADYWQTGSWIKRVQLSSLDMPATLRENTARGSKFILPSGPNEVTVRP